MSDDENNNKEVCMIDDFQRVINAQNHDQHHHRRYYYHSNDDYADNEFIDLTNEQYEEDSLPILIDLTSDNEIENDLVPKTLNNDGKETKNETITNDTVKFQPITPEITTNSLSSTQIPTNNSTQLAPQFYLSFLRKFIDENWRWANKQLNGRRVFLREQTNDFINGLIDPQQFIRNFQVDNILPVEQLTNVLKISLDIWRGVRANREVDIEQFFQLIPEIGPPPLVHSNSDTSTNSNQSTNDVSNQEIDVEPARKKLKQTDQEEAIQRLQKEVEQLKQSLKLACEKNEKHERSLKSFVGSLLNAMCPVCFEKLTEFAQKDVMVMPCKHVICHTCLDRCKDQTRGRGARAFLCPVCRFKFMRKKVITLYPSFGE